MKRMLQDFMGLFTGYDGEEPTTGEMVFFYGLLLFMVMVFIVFAPLIR